jgi:hypothetical protein
MLPTLGTRTELSPLERLPPDVHRHLVRVAPSILPALQLLSRTLRTSTLPLYAALGERPVSRTEFRHLLDRRRRRFDERPDLDEVTIRVGIYSPPGMVTPSTARYHSCLVLCMRHKDTWIRTDSYSQPEALSTRRDREPIPRDVLEWELVLSKILSCYEEVVLCGNESLPPPDYLYMLDLDSLHDVYAHRAQCVLLDPTYPRRMCTLDLCRAYHWIDAVLANANRSFTILGELLSYIRLPAHAPPTLAAVQSLTSTYVPRAEYVV